MATMNRQPAHTGTDGAKVLRRVALMRRGFGLVMAANGNAPAQDHAAQLVEYVHRRNVATMGHVLAEGIRAAAWADVYEKPLPVAEVVPATLADFEDSARGGL